MYKLYSDHVSSLLKFFHGFPFPSECNPVWADPGHPPASSHATPSQAPRPSISPTSHAFIWHRTFAYDIFSVQNTLLLGLHMTGCFSPVSPEITLSWEMPSWSPWLIYSGYSVLFANFNMWDSCTKFLAYSSEFFFVCLFRSIFLPFIIESVREVTISSLFISEYPVLAYNGISTSTYWELINE